MTRFHCIAIDTEIADRFRRTGRDDRGNTLRRIVATDGGGFPCRHCLRPAEPGETMLLGSYDLPRPTGIYWTPSPIFLHEAPCARAAGADEVPPIVRLNPLVSVRAYDGADQCVYELGQVCPGAEVDAPLARALGDARTAFVNIHTARPGCLLTRVERLPAGSVCEQASVSRVAEADAPPGRCAHGLRKHPHRPAGVLADAGRAPVGLSAPTSGLRCLRPRRPTRRSPAPWAMRAPRPSPSTPLGRPAC